MADRVDGIPVEEIAHCLECGRELWFENDKPVCENYRCIRCPDYEPPCPTCGSWDSIGYDREQRNLRICKNATCPACPWYNPYVKPLPALKWDDPVFKRAFRDYLWLNVRRHLYLNPGITFKDLRTEMSHRFGAFHGRDGSKAFSTSMQGMVARGEIKRYKKGWRFVKRPEREFWHMGEILEIAGVAID